MNPTPRLRFVERRRDAGTDFEGKPVYTYYKVLQQWFAYDIQYPMTRGEWRDVPLEKE